MGKNHLRKRLIPSLSLLLLGSSLARAEKIPDRIIEVEVSTREQRSALADLGYALEDIRSDRVFIWGEDADLEMIRQAGFRAKSADLPVRIYEKEMQERSQYHSYDSMVKALKQLESDHSNIVTLGSVGRSVQNRDIPLIRISGKSVGQAEAEQTPVIFYMGCHHAREHLSVEIPLMFAQYLASEYGHNPDVTRLVDAREIYIAPMVNPDGHSYDYTGVERGKMWRKNRRNNGDGTFGVDLNRNYGYHWGTGGSSTNTNSEIYMGPSAFSEPETQSIRDFVRAQPRMTTLLTLHTFSELILYPWGYTYDDVGENGQGSPEDGQIYRTMAETMAGWNHYTPEQSSDLYITSGDTTDWAYGELGIFAFTFELTPSTMQEGGFYPGNRAIQPTFAENVKPLMYLLEYSDSPRRVLSEQQAPSFEVTPARMGVALANYKDTLR